MIPPFVNDTCSIPQGVGGFLTKTLNQGSSDLADWESAWENYRDDAIQKANYLEMKISNSLGKISNLIEIANKYPGQITIDSKQISNKIFAHDSNFKTFLMFFVKLISSFNDYFLSQTVYLIILANQKLKNLLILNFNTANCRDGILNDFYYNLNQFSFNWIFYMSSLFYVGDVDAELSAAYSQSSNFLTNVENCLNGDSDLTISCLSQVKN